MDITLALGSGGAKGNSHIGVLRRLEEEGFKIRAVAGTSFGGIVAVMYAAGYTPDEIEDIFVKVDQARLYGRSLEERPSLLGLAGVRKWLDEVLPGRTFADLDIPCAVTAVDLNYGCEVVLDEGPVKDALLATIAVPGIFPAQPWQELGTGGWRCAQSCTCIGGTGAGAVTTGGCGHAARPNGRACPLHGYAWFQWCVKTDPGPPGTNSLLLRPLTFSCARWMWGIVP